MITNKQEDLRRNSRHDRRSPAVQFSIASYRKVLTVAQQNRVPFHILDWENSTVALLIPIVNICVAGFLSVIVRRRLEHSVGLCAHSFLFFFPV